MSPQELLLLPSWPDRSTSWVLLGTSAPSVKYKVRKLIVQKQSGPTRLVTPSHTWKWTSKWIERSTETRISKTICPAGIYNKQDSGGVAQRKSTHLACYRLWRHPQVCTSNLMVRLNKHKAENELENDDIIEYKICFKVSSRYTEKLISSLPKPKYETEYVS